MFHLVAVWSEGRFVENEPLRVEATHSIQSSKDKLIQIDRAGVIVPALPRNMVWNLLMDWRFMRSLT